MKNSSNKGKKRITDALNFDLNSAFNEIISTFTKGLSNPLVLLTIAVSLGMIFTHNFDTKKGYIYTTFTGEDVISKWIVAHGKKFCGMLTFLPAVIDSPKNMRALVGLLSFLWVMIVPEIKFAEYFLQSLALHTYFKLRTNNSKIVVIAAVGLAWFMGYFTPLKPAT